MGNISSLACLQDCLAEIGLEASEPNALHVIISERVSSEAAQQLIMYTRAIKKSVLAEKAFPNGHAMWRNERGRVHNTNIGAAITEGLLILALTPKCEPVGYISARRSSLGEPIAEITDLYLLANSRGRAQGSLGRRLLLSMLQKLREKSFKEVFLGTVPELEAAIRLYRQHGFRRRDEADQAASNLLYTRDKLTFEMVCSLEIQAGGNGIIKGPSF